MIFYAKDPRFNVCVCVCMAATPYFVILLTSNLTSRAVEIEQAKSQTLEFLHCKISPFSYMHPRAAKVLDFWSGFKDRC